MGEGGSLKVLLRLEKIQDPGLSKDPIRTMLQNMVWLRISFLDRPPTLTSTFYALALSSVYTSSLRNFFSEVQNRCIGRHTRLFFYSENEIVIL